MIITGATRLIGVVADPAHHLRTPQRLNGIFEERSIDAVCIAFEVPEERLAAAWAGFAAMSNLAGLVVTIPHKTAASRLCDAVGPDASVAGCVNVVRRELDGRMVGESFDGSGLVAGLRASGVDPAGRRLTLLGAGGAAASIAVALLRAGVSSVEIVNRTAARAEALAERLAGEFVDAEITTGGGSGTTIDLLVDATPVGSASESRLLFDPDRVASSTIVAEAAMTATPSELARVAAARGALFVGGRAMLDGQIESIIRHILSE